MNFSEYKFDKRMIKTLVAERAANLRANRGFSNLLAFALGVIADRINKDARRYRDYGPYWPALKQVLINNGYRMGEASDPLIAQAYCGDSDVETLIMADEFRTEYLKSSFVYTNEFVLDADGSEFWTLYDADLEAADFKVLK